MYSAVKRSGKPLHRLARRGITVEREARRAFISHIALTDWSPPDFSFEVTCSPGTYVRALAHDLGQKLGCGAHLTRLTRTRSGRFGLDEAVPLRELTLANWQSRLEPMEMAVADFPQLTLDARTAQRLIHGQLVPRLPEHPPADLARAHSAEGVFLALVRPSADGSGWLPHKVFA
jgi:tRNA pseudouridine55 synthase